ncbi:MAG: SDR family oxidoreductase [Ilumatobacteraceae bacterium]|nr:SDR family oxidoreductase [Ilumatobacteraceae bacterium]
MTTPRSSRNLFDLTDRVALITGGSRGLGREMALAFAQHGAHVIVASRKLENCEIVANEIRSLGQRSLAVAYHAASWTDADRLARVALDEFGSVDILVNNAGMSPLYPSVDQITEDLFDKVLGVNLKGPFRLSALLGTHMAQHDGGTIINVSSISSQRPGANEVIYGAAKAAVNNLTMSLARTFAPKVRVNCIVPGPFLTDISKAWDIDQFTKTARTNYALQRGGEPNEIVGAALYLASDASSYTTGSLLNVDGGPR